MKNSIFNIRCFLTIIALFVVVSTFFVSCSLNTRRGENAELFDNPGNNQSLVEEPIDDTQEELFPFYDFASKTDENGMITFSYKSDCEYENVNVSVTENGTTNDYNVVEKNIWSMQLEPNVLYAFKFNAYFEGKLVHTESCTRYYIPESNYNANFPRLEINTQNEIWPICDYVSAPAGCMGYGITNNNYVLSKINLYDKQNNMLFDSADNLSEEEKYSGAKVKVRGNTSAYSEKKPYKIKLNKKIDLLNGLVERTDEKDYSHKEWLLLASGNTLNTMVGFSVAETVGMDWTPAYTYTDLYVNGDYRGVYILCESVARGSGKGEKQSRCAVDKDGFIIESDAYWWNEDLYFGTSYHDRPVKYTFKYPDSDDIDENSSEYEYIKKFLIDFETTLQQSNQSWMDYIDVQSFAKWLLAHDILGTWDSGGANIYLTKKDSANSLLKMGPLWDFDSIFMQRNAFARIHYEHLFYYPDLLNRSEFIEAYQNAFVMVKDNVITNIQAKLNSLDSETYNQLLALNNTRWGKTNETLEQSIEELIKFFTEQLAWIDTQI